MRLTLSKRRAGDDVIDMSMGNPTDPPSEMVIEKLIEAARDPKNHGYSPALGIMSLRREAAAKYLKKYGVRLDPESEMIATLGSKEGFSHMCLALLGPGDMAIVPAPAYPAHMYAVALASGRRDFARSGRQRKAALEYRLHLPASASAAEGGDSQLSAQSVDGDRRSGVLCRCGEAARRVWLHDHQRLWRMPT